MKLHHEYLYVGSQSLKTLLAQTSRRFRVESSGGVREWIKATKQTFELDGTVVCTFIIDTDGHMWINDRRSEHFLCAAGQNVLSAGEITFALGKQTLEVIEITNQSTGYCPEPESWWAVDEALERAQLPHPSGFTTAYVFRKCETCGSINLVKDLWFECAVCDAPLSHEWNFQHLSTSEKMMSITIRSATSDHFPFLREILYYAIYVPQGQDAPPQSIIDLLEIAKYAADVRL